MKRREGSNVMEMKRQQTDHLAGMNTVKTAEWTVYLSFWCYIQIIFLVIKE